MRHLIHTAQATRARSSARPWERPEVAWSNISHTGGKRPLLHDARVYLSRLTRESFPASTVMTNREVTNAPLVVRTLDDAIRAAIELHDLPAPDDEKTPSVPGAGCPVPPGGRVGTNVDYSPSPAAVICPPYDSGLSQTHRSEAREVIRRFGALSPDDQQALIDFLKEL
jgi:hypothetical protein